MNVPECICKEQIICFLLPVLKEIIRIHSTNLYQMKDPVYLLDIVKYLLALQDGQIL